MTNNLEQLNSYANTSGNSNQSSRGESQMSELRRGTWLLQMERALLDANDFHGAPDPVKPAGHASLGVGLAEQVKSTTRKLATLHGKDTGTVSHADPHLSAGQATPDALTNPGRVEPQQAASAVRGATLASAGAAQRAINTETAPPQPSQSPQKPLSSQSAGQISQQQGDGSASGAGRGAIAAGSDNSLVPAHAGVHGVAYDLASLNPYQSDAGTSAVERGIQAGTEPDATRFNPVATLRAGLPVGAIGLRLAENLPEPKNGPQAEQDAPLPEPAAHTEEQAQTQEQYARRQLHLYQGADGIQAWIRDADVTQAKVQMIANALGNELNGSGLKLKALTVNGKKLGNVMPDESNELNESNESNDTGKESLAGAAPGLPAELTALLK